MNQVQELEQAILSRAERLATEYRERAHRSRDSILREASERLRLREAREEAIAKALAERTFRQRVQASELKMQSHLDLMRWNLVRDVEQRLEERMRMDLLFPDDLKPRIGDFTTEQLIGLRFASDDEFVDLCRKVLDEGMADRKSVKAAVKSWRADHQRI